jgi:hypothetical protein
VTVARRGNGVVLAAQPGGGAANELTASPNEYWIRFHYIEADLRNTAN